jgi:hypothetical protein
VRRPTVSKTTVYGIWTPTKEEVQFTNPMEAWPSMRAAEDSLRERLAPPPLGVSRCPTYYVSRPRQDDAQFYGSLESSAILLHHTADSEMPYAVLEFGPRGGVRLHPILQDAD